MTPNQERICLDGGIDTGDPPPIDALDEATALGHDVSAALLRE
ncbi:hypothetical protein [Haloarcula nitratireducens]|nr:hypothetical protein [Halomicroarcula nitratireducens]